MVGQNTRPTITLVSAPLTIVSSVIAFKLTDVLSNPQSWVLVGAWIAAGIIVPTCFRECKHAQNHYYHNEQKRKPIS